MLNNSVLLENTIELIEELNNIFIESMIIEHNIIINKNDNLLIENENNFFTKVKDWFVKFGMMISNWIKTQIDRIKMIILQARAYFLQKKIDKTHIPESRIKNFIIKNKPKISEHDLFILSGLVPLTDPEIEEIDTPVSLQFIKDKIGFEFDEYEKKLKSKSLEKKVNLTIEDFNLAFFTLYTGINTFYEELIKIQSKTKKTIESAIKLVKHNNKQPETVSIIVKNYKTQLTIYNTIVNNTVRYKFKKLNIAMNLIKSLNL